MPARSSWQGGESISVQSIKANGSYSILARSPLCSMRPKWSPWFTSQTWRPLLGEGRHYPLITLDGSLPPYPPYPTFTRFLILPTSLVSLAATPLQAIIISHLTSFSGSAGWWHSYQHPWYLHVFRLKSDGKGHVPLSQDFQQNLTESHWV